MLTYWETLMKESVVEDQFQLLATWLKQAESNGLVYNDLLALGEQLVNLGYSDLALYLLQGLHYIEPQPEIARLVSQLYTNLQQTELAIEWLEVIQPAERQPEDQLSLAQLYIEAAETQRGMKLLQELVHDAFHFAPGYFALADLYLEQGNVPQARELGEAVFTYFEDEESRHQARKYIVLSYLEEEMIPYQEILDLYQGENSELKVDTEDYYLQAYLYQQLGDYDKVIEVARQGLTTDEDSYGLHLLLMEAYSYTGQASELEKEIQWYLDHVPSDDDAIIQVAQYASDNQLLSTDLLDRLTGFLPYILETDLGYDTLNLVVDGYLAFDQVESARQAIVEAELMFTDMELAYLIGRVKEAEGECSQAIDYYEMAADQLIGPADLGDYIEKLKDQVDQTK